MRTKLLWLFLIVLLVGTGCSNNINKGDEMIVQGKPDVALRYYEKAAVKSPKDPVILRKIVQANILLAIKVLPVGQLARAKYCIDMVSRTYPKGIPDDLKKDLSEATALYGEALKKSNAVNDAIIALEKALELDPENEVAKRVLEASRSDYAAILLQRAKDALNNEEYGVADWNALKSLEYAPGLKEARKLLVVIRKKGLDSYDKNENICLALSGLKRYARKAMFMMFILNNYQDDYFTVKPNFFTLYDTKGRKYSYKASNYRKITKPMRTKELKPGPMKISEATGALVFSIPKNAKIAKIVFFDGKDHKVEKYFP